MAVVSRHSMGTENRLLLACCRSHLSEKDRDELNHVLSADPNWGLVIELADWHRISPLLYTHLGSSDWRARVPFSAMEHFEAAYYTTAARVAYYERELASILEVLHRWQIPVLLLKGSALIKMVYSDPGLRSMSDLDLLVPADRIEDAEHALREHGWEPVPEERDNLEMRESFRHIPPLSNPGGTATVELHRELVSPPIQWDVDRVWERSESLLPSPEDLLAHVALHFFMDRHERRAGALRQLMDMAEIVRAAPSLDWDLLLADAERSHVTGALSCGLWTARELLSLPVPNWVVDAAASDRSGADAFIQQRVLGSAPWPLRGLVRPHEDYTSTRAMRNAVGRLFPSRRYLESRYSESSSIYVVWLFYHLRDLALRWRKSIADPATVKRGILADRWLHSMLDRESARLPDH